MTSANKCPVLAPRCAPSGRCCRKKRGAADVRIPCSEACFASMGFAASTQHVTVRDLWTHTDNGTIAIVDGLSVVVQPSAVVMVKLTPA